MSLNIWQPANDAEKRENRLLFLTHINYQGNDDYTIRRNSIMNITGTRYSLRNVPVLFKNREYRVLHYMADR